MNNPKKLVVHPGSLMDYGLNLDIPAAGVTYSGVITYGTEVSATYKLTGVALANTKTLFGTPVTRGNLGGIAGADATCQSLADAGDVPAGTYKAVLSDSSTNAIDRLNISYPIISARRKLLFSENLFEGPIRGIIWSNISGSYLGFSHNNFWTGTLADGTASANTCNDWQNQTSSFSGQTARVTPSPRTFTFDNGIMGCGFSFNLLCLQQ